jgi:hypothetical protein
MHLEFEATTKAKIFTPHVFNEKTLIFFKQIHTIIL